MPELNIQFLDVGQGDGIFIEFPGGATMLVDLGSTKNKDIVSQDILKFFRKHTKFSKKGQTLDYLILTHADRDHYNMVEDFIEDAEVDVARLLYGGESKGKYGELISEIQRLCPKCEFIQPSYVFPTALPSPKGKSTFGGAEVDLLAIDAPATTNNATGWCKNTKSVVLMVTYEGVKVILAGDATRDTEKFISGVLMQKYKNKTSEVGKYLKSQVLKVGHHGSRRTSNSVEWIKYVKPQLLFISADRSGSLDNKNKSGHRLPQALTVSLFEKHSSLYGKCSTHTIVSSFDTTDYDG
jgi:competence protein ComEC